MSDFIIGLLENEKINDSVLLISFFLVFFIIWEVATHMKEIQNGFLYLFKWYDRKKEREELLGLLKEDHIRNGNIEKEMRIYKEHYEEQVQINNRMDALLENIIESNRVLLGDKINQKYKEYVSLGGVPEDEVSEFTNLHTAYHNVQGNHSGDAKYDYVMEHLPVIPVKTKLIYNTSIKKDKE